MKLDLPIIRVACYKLARDRPYLASALWALQFVESAKVLSGGTPTMGVDKYWRCYYHPALDWDVDGLATVLYHEISHLLHNHHARADAFKSALGTDAPLNYHELANICQDASINSGILEEGCHFPTAYHDKVVTPGALKAPPHLMWEEYWDYLKKQSKHVKVSIPGGCGSCAHGEKQDYEEGCTDTPRMSSTEAELIRRQVAKDVLEQRGTVPAGLRRWAEGILRPQVNWRKELAVAVRAAVAEIAGAANYCYRRPARRQSIYPEFVMPSLRRPLPRVGGQIDTSGSMSDANITSALAEVGGLLKSLGVAITWYATDAAITVTRNVFRAEQVRLVGGGGTDMRLGFNAALKERPKLDLFITLSDLYTPWPEVAPPFRSIIVDVTGGDIEAPKWAKLIRIRS